MPNKLRGEVALQAGEKTYTLHLSVNALCALENEVGRGANEIFVDLDKGNKVKVGTIRAIVWAALTDNHPEITLKEAGAIITEIGMADLVAKLAAAIVASYPEAKSDEARPT